MSNSLVGLLAVALLACTLALCREVRLRKALERLVHRLLHTLRNRNANKTPPDTPSDHNDPGSRM